MPDQPGPCLARPAGWTGPSEKAQPDVRLLFKVIVSVFYETHCTMMKLNFSSIESKSSSVVCVVSSFIHV